MTDACLMICSGIVYTKQSMYYYDNHVRGSAESLLTNQFNERKRVLNTAQLTTMCIYIYTHMYIIGLTLGHMLAISSYLMICYISIVGGSL